MGRVDVSAIPAPHIGCTGANLSQYGAGLGVIVVPVISRSLSNAETFQAGPFGIQVGDVPPVAVVYALRSHIPKNRPIRLPSVAAVDKFIDAVAIKIETSDLVVIGIVIDRVIQFLPPQRPGVVLEIKCIVRHCLRPTPFCLKHQGGMHAIKIGNAKMAGHLPKRGIVIGNQDARALFRAGDSVDCNDERVCVI